MNNKQAFTLIELLVVVLIIGILAAVALPQYQKAVEKSKATQAITLLKSVYNAAKAYQLANGSWPTDFDTLAVDVPFTGWTNYLTTGGHFMQGRSNKDWSIQIFRSINGKYHGVGIGRISGNYVGAAFWMYDSHEHVALPTDEILCAENRETAIKPFTKATGAYCNKILHATRIHTPADASTDYFKLP